MFYFVLGASFVYTTINIIHIPLLNQQIFQIGMIQKNYSKYKWANIFERMPSTFLFLALFAQQLQLVSYYSVSVNLVHLRWTVDHIKVVLKIIKPFHVVYVHE